MQITGLATAGYCTKLILACKQKKNLFSLLRGQREENREQGSGKDKEHKRIEDSRTADRRQMTEDRRHEGRWQRTKGQEDRRTENRTLNFTWECPIGWPFFSNEISMTWYNELADFVWDYFIFCAIHLSTFCGLQNIFFFANFHWSFWNVMLFWTLAFVTVALLNPIKTYTLTFLVFSSL